MKKILFHPFYVTIVLLALCNQIIEKNGVFIPYIHSYLDDVLCFPLVLTTGLSVYRSIWPDYRLGFWHIWPLFLFFVIYFEWWLPGLSIVYTRDPWDIAAYLSGICLFHYVMNTEKQKVIQNGKSSDFSES
jgi:hypothetical protein